MKLEVGALYEMSNGTVARCTAHGAEYDWYAIGGYWYDNAGRPQYNWQLPTVKHKLQVNEPPEPETPKPIPFKIDGPGWYRLRLGSWVKLTLINGWFRNWDENGVSRLPWALSDVISKATPEQSRILDAL